MLHFECLIINEYWARIRNWSDPDFLARSGSGKTNCSGSESDPAVTNVNYKSLKQQILTYKILSPQYFTKMLCLKSLYFYSKESKLGKSFKTPNIFSIHGLAVASLAAVRGRGSNPASNIRPYGSHTSITT